MPEASSYAECLFFCTADITGFLPFNYLFDLKRMKFYSMLNASRVNPASILFHWFGQNEVSDRANEYNLSDAFNKSSAVQMIWTSFEKYCSTIR